MTVLYRCQMCDANLYKPVPVEVEGDDPPVSACYKAVMLDHAEKHQDCAAARTDVQWVSVDFLVRMVQ